MILTVWTFVFGWHQTIAMTCSILLSIWCFFFFFWMDFAEKKSVYVNVIKWNCCYYFSIKFDKTLCGQLPMPSKGTHLFLLSKKAFTISPNNFHCLYHSELNCTSSYPLKFQLIFKFIFLCLIAFNLRLQVFDIRYLGIQFSFSLN